MKKIILVLFILFIIFVTNLYAEKDKWNQQLYDSVRYAEDGNTKIVDLEQIKLSLAKGANPNWIKFQEGKARVYGQSILSNYVSTLSLSDNPKTDKKGLKAIEMLFEHGAKLQSYDGSILFFPIANGKHDIVKLLLKKGASATFWPKHKIGGRDYHLTPIDEATARGYEKIVELLVSYGAKRLSKKDAVQARFVEVARFGSINELKGLLKEGAKINRRNKQEETALLNALGGFYDRSTTYVKVISLIYGMGADVNQQGKGRFGMTFPLHEAIIFSSFIFNSKKKVAFYAEEILQSLIEKGAYISGRDEDDRTPLHIAAQYNNLYAAQLLLDSGSKVMPKDKSGKTPLDYAESSEMIKLLKKYGAKEL